MSYAALLYDLYQTNMGREVKLGLENAQKIAACLNHPERQFASIHIAGTNGKGSVSHKIAHALAHSGKRVGLYTSPHISTFRERIRINGEMIDEQAVRRHLSALFSLVRCEQIPATFFELTTAMAFSYFAEQQVDIAVCETGLGGRLDATNIITPLLTIITSLSYDHTEILGNSLEEIAYEKLGIAKPGVPIILSPRLQNSALVMTYEEENCLTAACALKRLSIPEASVQAGLRTCQPCRFELLEKNGRTIILDVAHNPAGIKELLHTLRQRFPHRRLHCLTSLSKTKDLAGCLQLLRRECAFFYLFDAPHQRLAKPCSLTSYLSAQRTKVFTRMDEALNWALCAADSDDLLLICGSFFIMGEVRRLLGIEEPADAFDLNENFAKG